MNFKKKMILFLTAFAVLVLAMIVPAFAAGDSQALIRGIRPMSMGGAFTAVVDDQNAFFYNPAGITQRRTALKQIFTMDFAANTRTFDFVDFYSDTRDDVNNFSDLTPGQQADLISRVNNEIIGKFPNVIIGMPNIAYISAPIEIRDDILSFGVGFFSYADAYFGFNRTIIPSFTYLAQYTGILAVPVAYQINSLEKIKVPGKLSAGLNIKYITRGKVEDTKLSLAEFEALSNKAPTQTGDGFGFDFGLLYALNERWNFGLQLTDAFYTNIKYGEFIDNDYPYRSRPACTSGIRPVWNMGASYVPGKIYFWKDKYIETSNRFTFVADIRDVANGDETLFESFWKKLHFGGEFKLSPLIIRAGFNSGYPTIGIAMASNAVQFEYAFYGVEEGRYAGQDPSWFHRLVFSVKIGENGGKPHGKAMNNE